MKTLSLITIAALLAFAGAQAQIIPITVTNFAPNGTASGGSGSGTGALSTTVGSIGTDRGMPVITYTVSSLDLTSLGGTASESFTFTLSYTATTDGSTAGTPQFNGFGNVSVTGGDNNQVDGAETLSASIALTSTSFGGLSLSGFTELRAGGVSTGEAGTFAWTGGSFDITSNANRTAIIDPADGITAFTLSVSNPMNFEGFKAEFVAVPEPATFVLMAGLATLGVILMRRRRG